ncbi:maleylpyruvate isomerase family mycothiol-dependent enzyme [Nocardia sp. XZ_19_369]|uniref:maleylpyruvate isomerase family mycothiol-dependent enzyme n=1 Tax=Nocardia sp. XZ_19_369 TaxID=2769487 RepID=UPI001E5DAAF7|nr:maleylpyruvate isomerase family mycothiol-dependent enzyme [Nocardia sp. XZ_19_369]
MDVRGMLAEERAELISLLRALSDEEWESPSLCAGWRVRDVVGHLLYDTIALPTYGGIAVRCGLSVDRFNGRLVEKAKTLSTRDLVDRFEHAAGRVSKYAPRLALADVLVHQQDIRRPLGRARTIPADRLITVLEHPDPFAMPWRRTRGLRFVATDVSWSKGHGPEVRGPGEAIVLAMVGRAVAVDELAGDGVVELRRRCG